MHRPNELELATMRLATGVTLHYAEQVDPNGEAVILLHGYSDQVVRDLEAFMVEERTA
jgi:hypothetical protein